VVLKAVQEEEEEEDKEAIVYAFEIIC